MFLREERSIKKTIYLKINYTKKFCHYKYLQNKLILSLKQREVLEILFEKKFNY